MHWTRVSILLPAGAVEAAEAVLFARGALSVAAADGGDAAVNAGSWTETGESPWPSVRLEALFDPEVAPAALRDALAAAVDPAALASFACDRLEDRDWSRVWMQEWRPLLFGSRLWICPTWLEPPDPQAVNLRLDPGGAFGTGTHATTALCLEWLAAQDLGGRSCLDYGCGSGVLAIAALRLGAARAWACDDDPQALRATAENAARNDVEPSLWIGTPEALPDLAVDVLVANILSQVLVDLAPRLIGCLRQGGALAVAGILEEQADAVIAAYSPGCRLETVARCDGWVLLAGTRR